MDNNKVDFKYVMTKAVVLFVEGRLKFNGMKTTAPFPSMLAIYARRHKEEI